MLIRVIAKNILSFGEQQEFNMLPASKQTNLKHHKYNQAGVSVLKMAAIYGANAAGKSNLIKILSFVDDFANDKITPSELYRKKHKFSPTGMPIILAIEFIHNSKAYIYGFEILHNKILTEELYLSGLGKKKNSLIFERKTINENETKLTFHKDFEEDAESQVLKKVLEKNLIKLNKPALKFLSELDNPFLKEISNVLNWFEDNFDVILPDSKAGTLPLMLDSDSFFKQYANEFVNSLDTGIHNIKTETKSLQQYFGEDELDEIQKIKEHFENAPDNVVGLRNDSIGEEIIIVQEDDKIVVKKLVLEHKGSDNQVKEFPIGEESDGTIRLLDYIPFFYNIIDLEKTYVVDEIERSIHPLLIKALIKKFSENPDTKGQLIFTTHESHLLDQDIFRQDEIWFAEKDTSGSTDLYPLSEFKEHHSKNIQKGYLNGRYGGIPFLANLKELNWKQYATTEH